MTRNNHSSSGGGNFWSGLFLGTIFGATGLYLFGTKKGRIMLKNLLEATEDFEEVITDAIEDIREHAEETKKTTSNESESSGTLQSVIDKIQSVLPEKKEIKKYFSRDGKILKSI